MSTSVDDRGYPGAGRGSSVASLLSTVSNTLRDFFLFGLPCGRRRLRKNKNAPPRLMHQIYGELRVRCSHNPTDGEIYQTPVTRFTILCDFQNILATAKQFAVVYFQSLTFNLRPKLFFEIPNVDVKLKSMLTCQAVFVQLAEGLIVVSRRKVFVMFEVVSLC